MSDCGSVLNMKTVPSVWLLTTLLGNYSIMLQLHCDFGCVWVPRMSVNLGWGREFEGGLVRQKQLRLIQVKPDSDRLQMFTYSAQAY